MKLRIKNVLALVCFILTFIILVLVQHSREYHNTPQIQTIPQIQKKPVKKPVKVIKQKEYIELYAKITAYTPGKESCGKHANGRTSINKNAWKMDGIAVDPKAIPYGTKVWIDGIGFKEADDTGGAIVGAMITFNGIVYSTGVGGVATLTAPEYDEDSEEYTIEVTFQNYVKISKVVKIGPAPGVPGFELLSLIAAIGVAFILFRRRRN